MTRLPPALVAMLPPIWQEPRAPQVHGQEQSGCACRFLHGLQGRAGQHSDRAGCGVDFFDAVQPRQRECNVAFGRCGTCHQAGESTLGGNRLVVSATDRHYLGHFIWRSRAYQCQWRAGVSMEPVGAVLGWNVCVGQYVRGTHSPGEFID